MGTAETTRRVEEDGRLGEQGEHGARGRKHLLANSIG
jgi:hypothetical protein